MANKYIHSINVEYDDQSDTVKAYLEHLEYNLTHEELRAFIESAKHDSLGKVHLEDRHGNKVTLEYISEESCLIRKRQL